MTLATYSCDTGFFLNSNETRECLSDGSWNNVDPQCSGEPFVTHLNGYLVFI